MAGKRPMNGGFNRTIVYNLEVAMFDYQMVTDSFSFVVCES